MPHLRFRGCQQFEVIEISRRLVTRLSELLDCPKEDFTMEYVETQFIFDGLEDANKYPFIEVLWFARDAFKQDVVDIINELLKPYNHEYVTVYFNNLNPGDYYENGKHF